MNLKVVAPMFKRVIIIMPNMNAHKKISPLIYPSEGQRPRITPLKATRSWESWDTSPHENPISLVSLSTSLLQVFLGLPFFLFPCGFHVRACLVMLSFGFLRVWPIHFHFLIFMSSSIGLWLVLRHNSSFVILSGQWIWRIFLRQEFTNVCTLLIGVAFIL